MTRMTRQSDRQRMRLVSWIVRQTVKMKKRMTMTLKMVEEAPTQPGQPGQHSVR